MNAVISAVIVQWDTYYKKIFGEMFFPHLWQHGLKKIVCSIKYLQTEVKVWNTWQRKIIFLAVIYRSSAQRHRTVAYRGQRHAFSSWWWRVFSSIVLLLVNRLDDSIWLLPWFLQKYCVNCRRETFYHLLKGKNLRSLKRGTPRCREKQFLTLC